MYKNTVIRRAEIDTSESVEDEPRVTVVLERAIEVSRIFRFAQDLMTHKEAAKVHRLFFSEVRFDSSSNSSTDTSLFNEALQRETCSVGGI